jgi:hypothetical protein
MATGTHLSTAMSPSTPEEAESMRDIPYTNVVGALNYLAIATRPDIAYAVGCLARFNANPGPKHWTAAKHLLRYLKGSADLQLTYAPNTPNVPFEMWADADHGGNPDNGRSTTGYVAKMGGGAVSWGSKLQSVVTLSTTEAEYIAATTAGTEVIWLRALLEEMGLDTMEPSCIHMDNQSAMSVAKNPEHHGRMKHLDLRYFWLRDKVAEQAISVDYVPTNEMTADLLTKALPRDAVERHRRAMGVI